MLRAVWLIPAILLLSTGNWLAESFGFLLAMNTARILANWQEASTIWGELWPILTGVLAIESGLIGMVAGYPFKAAALAVVGTAILKRATIAKGAFQPRRKTAGFPFSIALAFLLAAVLSTGKLARVDAPSLLALAKSLMKGSTPTPTRLAADQGVAGAAASGVPGVILRPQPVRHATILTLRPPGRPHLGLFRDLTIPFTGDYHLYLAASGFLPRDAVLYVGLTPFTRHYQANDGGFMETEAYQKIDPPIDFSNCGKILMTVHSAEATRASATLQLLAGSGLQEIGIRTLGVDTDLNETVTFDMPAEFGSAAVSAIRVLFRHTVTRQDQSARVAIEQFRLVSRVL